MKNLWVLILALAVFGCATPVFDYEQDKNSVVQIVTDYTHGTGFYIGDGLIMTAKHVVPEVLQVGFYLRIESPVYYYIDDETGTRKNLEVIFRSEFTDVAICRTRHDHNLKPVVLSETTAPIGTEIYTVAFPQFLTWTYSVGYVMSELVHFGGAGREHIRKLLVGPYFAYNIGASGGSSGAPIWMNSDIGPVVVGMVNAKFRDGDTCFGLTVHGLRTALKEMEATNANKETVTP